jgi:hypothetical protein
MHCDDNIFARTKEAALGLAKNAVVHMEFNAWSPADLQNMRNWRSSFLSDRWIRDYPGEYRGHPRVRKIRNHRHSARHQFCRQYRAHDD